jgi:RND family efflux transporter MFP subunit
LTFGYPKVNFFFYSMCRPTIILSVALFFILLSSCGRSRGKDDVKPRYVRATRVSAVDYIDRDFAGMATADDAVNLAFKLSGQVLSVDVAKGDYVKKGELLSRLDPSDVELQVASDLSQYERARAQEERMKRLLSHEAVSQQEYEAAYAAFVQARSIYENSQSLLADTRLRAPFAGVVERTYVDTYQRVQSGQTIVRLVNPMSTTVEFTMPEKSLYLLSDSTTRYYVRFDNFPNETFSARLDTYAKTASDASGFPVALKISKAESEQYGISPGMTCQVTLQVSDSATHDLAIPLSAVYSPAEGGTYVWVITSANIVEQRRVELGNIFGRDMVSVQQGLSAGEQIVTAGVYRLQEGQQVKILNP